MLERRYHISPKALKRLLRTAPMRTAARSAGNFYLVVLTRPSRGVLNVQIEGPSGPNGALWGHKSGLQQCRETRLASTSIRPKRAVAHFQHFFLHISMLACCAVSAFSGRNFAFSFVMQSSIFVHVIYLSLLLSCPFLPCLHPLLECPPNYSIIMIYDYDKPPSSTSSSPAKLPPRLLSSP